MARPPRRGRERWSPRSGSVRRSDVSTSTALSWTLLCCGKAPAGPREAVCSRAGSNGRRVHGSRQRSCHRALRRLGFTGSAMRKCCPGCGSRVSLALAPAYAPESGYGLGPWQAGRAGARRGTVLAVPPGFSERAFQAKARRDGNPARRQILDRMMEVETVQTQRPEREAGGTSDRRVAIPRPRAEEPPSSRSRPSAGCR